MMSSERATRSMSRRSYLRALGVASITPAVATGVTAAGAGDGEYDQVVDIVAAGADNTGTEPIDDVFAAVAEDDTLVTFPAGTYVANNLGLYRRRNFAMVGEGDATLVPGDDYDAERWIAGAETENLRIENFTFDHTAPGVAPEVDISAYDGLVIRNIYKKGFQPGGDVALGFRILDSTGSGLIENLRAPDGGTSAGVYLASDGPITVRDCHVERFHDNGLYASHSTAPISVEGGTYRNNGVAQVRLGSAGSSIRGADVVIDDSVPPNQDVINMRGVRIADGPGPVSIENCDLRMERGEGSGAVVGAFSGGSFDVRDTRIYVGEEYTTNGSDGTRTSYGILVDDATATAPGERTIENVSITGGGTFRAAMAFRRDHNLVRNCCIHQTGRGRNGVFFEGCTDNEVSATTIDVTDEELVFQDAAAETSDIATDGACPLPGGGTQGDTGAVPGEIGTVRVWQGSADEWESVALGRTDADPVVIAKPVSYGGVNPCHARLRSVSSDSFAVKLEEWLYLDGSHTVETLPYLALETGRYSLGDRPAEVGTVTTDHNFARVGFEQTFETAPVVFAQTQTYNGPHPVVTRQRDVTADGTSVRVQEEEGAANGGFHTTETVGYVAVEPGIDTFDGRPYEVRRAGDAIPGSWHRIDFERSYSAPRLVADLQTYAGPNTAGIRYRNLTGTGVEVRIEEEQSADREVNHRPERVGYLVVDGD